MEVPKYDGEYGESPQTPDDNDVSFFAKVNAAKTSNLYVAFCGS